MEIFNKFQSAATLVAPITRVREHCRDSVAHVLSVVFNAEIEHDSDTIAHPAAQTESAYNVDTTSAELDAQHSVPSRKNDISALLKTLDSEPALNPVKIIVTTLDAYLTFRAAGLPRKLTTDELNQIIFETDARIFEVPYELIFTQNELNRHAKVRKMSVSYDTEDESICAHIEFDIVLLNSHKVEVCFKC